MVVRIVELIIPQGLLKCPTKREATHHTLCLLLIWKLDDSLTEK